MGRGNLRESVARFFAEAMKRHRPYQWLVLAAVVAVPLQQLPVVDVGFPLKITEVLIFAALVAWACDPRRTIGVRRPEVWILAAFAAVTVISTVYALINASPDARYNGIDHSLAFDSFLYFGYGAVIFAFWALLRTVPSVSIHRSVIYAVYIAAAAVAVQFIGAQVEAFDFLRALGFRVDVWGAQFGPLVSLRTGSFVEGQHLGFFAGAAVIVSVLRRSISGYIAAGLAVLCVIYSQSTTAFAGVALALLITCILRPRVRTLLVVGGTGLLALIVVLVIPPLRGLVAYQLAKVGLLQGEAPEGADVSLDIRGEKTAVGFDIMWAHPLTGAGPGRYGVWFQQFVDPGAVPERYFERDDLRAIAENVYAQIAAEYGVLGILLFVAFLVCVFLRVRKSQFADVALIVYIAIAIATQSSWTFLPIWAFLGYLASVSAESDEPILRRRRKEPSLAELGPRRRYRAEENRPGTSDPS